jgi:hypothetical protein
MASKARPHTPLDSKLLDNNDTSSLVLLRDLGEIHGNLRRGNTNADAIEDTARNQLAEVLASNLDGRAQNPPETSNPDGVSTADFVTDGTGDERADDGTGGERRADSTLDDAVRIVEVLDVLFRANDCGHGGDVEAEAVRC